MTGNESEAVPAFFYPLPGVGASGRSSREGTKMVFLGANMLYFKIF